MADSATEINKTVDGGSRASLSWDELVQQLYGLRRFGIEPGLERVDAVLGRERRADETCVSVHVAGTNGKGTVASMIAAVAQAHGLRVGLYTSPHLIGIRERFRVDGRPLPVEDVQPVLQRLLRRYDPAEQHDEPALTFFECTTVAAALLFEDAGVDLAVYEVGLGGRLDAVNAMEPTVSVVTTVGTDHTEYLGETIEEIAAEKAGIFRGDVPAVVGRQEHREAARGLADEARRCGAELNEVASDGGGLVQRHRQTARVASEIVLGTRFCEQKYERGLNCWRWPGRFEELTTESGRTLVVDAAHNRDGLRALSSMIDEREEPPSAVIWGAMADKEPGEIQRFFRRLGSPVWGALIAGDRARSGEQLRRRVPEPLWQEASTTESALEEALCQTEGDVLVFGSVYLVGELYEALNRSVDSLVTYGDDH